jgi:hypothetical protein
MGKKDDVSPLDGETRLIGVLAQYRISRRFSYQFSSRHVLFSATAISFAKLALKTGRCIIAG